MSGAVGLVATDGLQAPMAELDRELMAATGRDRPRVVLLALDGRDERDGHRSGHGEATWAPGGEDDQDRPLTGGGFEIGASPDPAAETFRLLGAEVEPIRIDDPRNGPRRGATMDASLQAIGEADVIYVAAGPPAALGRALLASPVGDAVVVAHRRGSIVVGCGAGAVLLGGSRLELRPRIVPAPLGWGPGLGLIPGVVVLTDYDARPEPVMAALALLGSRHATFVGIDRDTAAIGRDGAMRVFGRGRVTVWRGRHRDRHRQGETFRL